ncbi:hypothetical protein E4U41_000777 [Claviceps citrina]|nr:hypothetical protein E4U41_000777 [Claviceps citrina]
MKDATNRQFWPTNIMIEWALIFGRRDRTGTRQKTRRRPHGTRETSTKAAAGTNTPSNGKSHLGVIPDLIWLAERSTSIRYSYFCNPCVQHVSKLRHEGGFCGYRNIQCLISFLISTRSSGCESFGNKLPSIFQIQDLIERAWDMGFNSNGRLETGGIRGTRKYIGTPEAQALFSSVSVPCSAKAFCGTKNEKPYEELLKEIEAYFEKACSTDEHGKIRPTDLPPVYLQHQDNESCLYVFDPSSRNPQAIKKHSRSHCLENDKSKIESIIRVYRRGKGYLGKHDKFELLL